MVYAYCTSLPEDNGLLYICSLLEQLFPAAPHSPTSAATLLLAITVTLQPPYPALFISTHLPASAAATADQQSCASTTCGPSCLCAAWRRPYPVQSPTVTRQHHLLLQLPVYRLQDAVASDAAPTDPCAFPAAATPSNSAHVLLLPAARLVHSAAHRPARCHRCCGWALLRTAARGVGHPRMHVA